MRVEPPADVAPRPLPRAAEVAPVEPRVVAAVPETTPGSPLPEPYSASPPSSPPTLRDAPSVGPPPPSPGSVAEPVVATTAPEAPRPTPCEAARRLRTPVGQRRSQALADCVEGWVKGEVQELRDGVERQAGEFFAALDRLHRDVRRFGSKVFGPD